MDLYPPSINSEVLQLSERVARAKSMFVKHKEDNLQFAFRFGRELNSIKEQCTYQGVAWLSELAKIGVPHSTATNYMNADKNKPLIESYISRFGNEPPIWSEIVEFMRKDEESKPRTCGARECRHKGWPNDCKKCRKLNRKLLPKPPVPVYPESVKPVFDWVAKYEKAKRTARSLNKQLRKIEASLPFLASTKGRKKDYLADKAVNIERTLESIVPAEPCAACDGNISPNPDSEPCETCDGKGFLTVFDKHQGAKDQEK